ncbi:MAG: 50S ribosomal protein L10 [Acidimicrobiia bacterium]|nr:50S ribosomal protein L10 [Acidimicrobiia bacterium]
MENPRPEKVAVVDEVKAKLEAADGVVLTGYRGLDVPAMAELRTALRAAGAEYKIYKNTLVRFAAQQVGLELDEMLIGPTALAFVSPSDDGTPGDAVALAKALADFAKSNDLLIIKGGLLGDAPMSSAEVKALAGMPPRAQLFAEFVGAGESFYQEFAGLLDSKLREFSYALQELVDKGVLAPGEEPVEEPVDEPAADADEAGAPEATESEAEAAATAVEETAEETVEETVDESEDAAAEVGDDNESADGSNDEAADGGESEES